MEGHSLVLVRVNRVNHSSCVDHRLRLLAEFSLLNRIKIECTVHIIMCMVMFNNYFFVKFLKMIYISIKAMNKKKILSILLKKWFYTLFPLKFKLHLLFSVFLKFKVHFVKHLSICCLEFTENFIETRMCSFLPLSFKWF